MKDYFSRKAISFIASITIHAKTKTKDMLKTLRKIRHNARTTFKTYLKQSHNLISTLRTLFRLSNHFLSKMVIAVVVLLVGFSDTAAFNGVALNNAQTEDHSQHQATNSPEANQPQALVASTEFTPQTSNIGYIPITSGGTLIKPEVVSQTYSKKKLRASVVNYTVKKGDTVSTIASQFELSSKTVAYANGLGAGDSIKQGQAIKILPMDGVLYVPTAEEGVEALASKFKVSEQEIVEENNLDEEVVAAGTEVIIPNAYIPDAPKPVPVVTPTPQPQQNNNAKQKPKVAGVTSTPKIKYGGGAGHKFPYGYCTYWAASKRGGVPWGGNAKEWAYRASAMGYATGKTPVVGAVYVETWLTRWGHVSYVESVNGNTFTVSEMNYAGFGKVSTRTITGGGGTFIY